MSDFSVIPFRRPRTYLDECRAQGVFQSFEEMKAQNDELKSKLSKVRRETSAHVVRFADLSDNGRHFANAVDMQMGELTEKVEKYLDAYSKIVDPKCGPLLKHAIFADHMPADQAEVLFHAALSDNGVLSNDKNES